MGSKGYCIRFFLLAAGLTVTVLTPVIFNSVDGDIMTHVWMYVIPATAGVLGLPAFWPRKVTVINTYRNGWEQVYIDNNKEVLYYRDPEGKLHTKLPAELPLPEASVDTQDLSPAGGGAYTWTGATDVGNRSTYWQRAPDAGFANGAAGPAPTAAWKQANDDDDAPALPQQGGRNPAQGATHTAPIASTLPEEALGGGGGGGANGLERRRLASPMRRL